MSLASTYAADYVTAQESLPAPFTGPGGVLNASVGVDNNGNPTCVLTINNTQTFAVPPAVISLFVTWYNATFT